MVTGVAKQMSLCFIRAVCVETNVALSITGHFAKNFLIVVSLVPFAMEASSQYIFRRVHKTAKSDVNFVMSARPSVCPSAWNDSAPTGRILMKLDI